MESATTGGIMTNARDQLMNEWINYGGAAYRRSEAYQDALEATGSKAGADLFAFGPNAQVIPDEELPYYLAVREAIERERVCESIKAGNLPESRAASERRDKIIIKLGQVAPDMEVPEIDYTQFDMTSGGAER